VDKKIYGVWEGAAPDNGERIAGPEHALRRFQAGKGEIPGREVY
jgi:hypothetical protein